MDRRSYTFINCPNFRVAPGDLNGWKVQYREDLTSEWIDVPNGWYRDSQLAIKLAISLCRD